MSLPTVSGTARILTEPTRKLTKTHEPMSNALIKFQGWKKDGDGKWTEGEEVLASVLAFGDVAKQFAGFAKGDDVEVSGIGTLQMWKDKPQLLLSLKSVAAVEKRARDREPVPA